MPSKCAAPPGPKTLPQDCVSAEAILSRSRRFNSSRGTDGEPRTRRQDNQHVFSGRSPREAFTIYCASKAAVISITQSAGLELIRKKINVNGIAPGVVDTPMWDKVDALFAKYENRPIGEKKRLVGEAVPFGRMGTPEDHVGAAVFLASSESDYVVAQTLNVDGGNWLS